MDLVLSWLLAPALLLIAAVGLSLLVERLSAFALPWALRPALGLAAIIVLAQFGTTSEATAKLTLPAVLALAAAGIALGRPWQIERPGRAELIVAAVVFGVFAAPVVANGEATWAGYLQLDDSATWMAITDHSFEHGRGAGILPPSTHEQIVSVYLGKSYPIGGFVSAKLLSFLSAEDIAFTLQPAMAFSALALALVLFELLRRPLRSDTAAAAAAVVASLSSILLGYYLWGQSKEIAAAALLALGPALAGPAARARWPLRGFVAFGVSTAALVAVLGPGGLVWITPPLIAIVVVLGRDRGRELAVELGGRVMLLTFALAIPVLVTPEGVFNPVDPVLTEASEVSTLNDPLNPLQVAGLWPANDFRDDPHLEPLVLWLCGVGLLLAAIGIVAGARLRGREGLPFAAYAGGAALGGLVIMILGSPWVDAKAMTILSPAVLAAAFAGLALLASRQPLRIPVLGLGALIAAFVGWSAFLAYQGASLAPREQYVELEQIGERFAGQGPALDTNASFYGARHFLADLDPESTTDVRPRQLVLVDGSLLNPATGWVDIDQIRTGQLAVYNLLVLPRSPATSRPTRAFELAYGGEYSEVWRRIPEAPFPDGSLAIGGALDAAAIPACRRVRKLAELALPDGHLVAQRAPDPIAVPIGDASLPQRWERLTRYTVKARGSAAVSVEIEAPAGPYEVLTGGKIFGRATVSVDGAEVGSARGDLFPTNDYKPIGTVELDRGSHQVELEYAGAGLYPGSARPATVGPMQLAPVVERDLGAVEVPAADYERLCDRRWDWIEAYAT